MSRRVAEADRFYAALCVKNKREYFYIHFLLKIECDPSIGRIVLIMSSTMTFLNLQYMIDTFDRQPKKNKENLCYFLNKNSSIAFPLHRKEKL